MQGMLQPPSTTAFDAAASILSLLVYLGTAVAVMAREPGDARARTFLAVAVASAGPYALPALQWWKGNSVYTAFAIAVVALSFAVGSVALFHFTQVFPRRRPFVAAHSWSIAAAYLVLPVPVAAVAWTFGSLAIAVSADTGSGGLGAVSVGFAVPMLAVTILLIVVVGAMLPLAGVLSLVKSWREAQQDRRERDRAATLWMLVSQLGGGVLAILVLPMLHLIGVGPPWSIVIAALTYGFALLLPLAFARYMMFSTSTG